MFKNIDKINQKKLKRISIWSQLFYVIFTFILPIVVVIAMIYNNNGLAPKVRLPLVSIIIIASVLNTSTHYFANAIKKIKILNLDGSYDKPMRTFKHILSSISTVIMPIAVLVIACMFKEFGIEQLIFFTKMIGTVCICYIIGGLYNSMIVSCINEELEIRDALAHQNAISRRSDLI